MNRIYFKGGFHNSSETYVEVSDKAYDAFDDVADGKEGLTEWVNNYLTESQEKRLDNHFCGIKGCTCGSYARAEAYKK